VYLATAAPLAARANTGPGASRYAKSVTTSESGRIVAEIDYPVLNELHGKALVYEPEVRGGQIVAWHCHVPEAPLKHFPPACRSRGAAPGGK
jgi:hypothetical protein